MIIFFQEVDFIGHIVLSTMVHHHNTQICVIHLRIPILTLIHRLIINMHQLIEGKTF